MPRHRSSAIPLTVAYAALVVYASLYPFSGWYHPLGVLSPAALNLPWVRGWGAFDVLSNLLGYLPLGFLTFAAVLRSGYRTRYAAAAAVLLPSLLSLLLELLQNYLPERVPSLLDWALNSCGATLGAVLAALAHGLGATPRWQTLRDRWFVARSAGALTLLLLWPVGLLFPAPVPLGLGQVLPQLQAGVAAVAEGVSWAPGWLAAFAHAAAPQPHLTLATEWALVALGLLTPCMLAYTVTRPSWRRGVLVLGAAALGFATTTLSTALNFAPQHALAWLTPAVLPAFGTAILLAALLAGAPRRTAAALGLVVATALVALVAQAPADPYFADSLQAWEQGRFIRFHGVAQWVGWLWPYAVLAYLLVRVGERGES